MRRTCIIVVAVCVACLFAGPAALAQAPAPPKPGPEVQKLNYFVGQWKFEGEDKQTPFGPGGKFSGTETCQWFAGGFQVVCRATATGPAGKATAMSIYAYDSETKQYTFYAIDSTGFNLLARSAVSGDTWTYDWSGTIGGKPVKIRGTTQTSPDSYIGTTEGSIGGDPMVVIAELKATRVK